jgi:hypothetical protein
LKQLNNKRAVAAPQAVPQPANHASPEQPEVALRLKHARNKANTIRNAAKVESYLMDIEKAHGHAKSWALRERLEQGHVSLDELKQR